MATTDDGVSGRQSGRVQEGPTRDGEHFAEWLLSAEGSKDAYARFYRRLVILARWAISAGQQEKK